MSKFAAVARKKTVPRRDVLASLLLVISVSMGGLADLKYKPWIEKDWTQWTDRDCNIISNGSPWNYATDSPGVSMNGPRVSASSGTQVQLRSALPIRQVIFRQLQLDKRYDKMKADKKQTFDQEHLHDLDPIDQVKIYIKNWSFEPAPGAGSVRPDRISGPQPPTQAALRLSDGTLVLPIHTTEVKYDPSAYGTFQNQFEYVFPRVVEGKPLYSPSDSDLEVVVGAPLNIDKKTKQVIQEPFRYTRPVAVFKIADLMYKGKLEY